MKDKTIKRFASIALPILVLATESCFADDTCALNFPPLDAAVSGNHGEYLFVFPRKVPPSFSGCQIMWDEQGNKVSVFRFSSGALNEFSFTEPSRSHDTIVCKYKNERLTTNSPKECSAYEDVKDGLLNVDPSEEPLVPKERDARLEQAGSSMRPTR